MKKTLLTALAAAAIAVGAQAQIINALPGKALIFSSVATAPGWGEITYQWYRDGQPIPGATDTVYTLPGNLAYGQHVEFKRGVTSSICPGEMLYSNVYLITFCALKVNNICWVAENLDDFRTFAARPDMYTKFFQWNKLMPYSASNPISPAWDAAANTSSTWTNSPCPLGWRLPDRTDFQALNNASGGSGGNNGGTWAAANAKGNAVAGRFYGPNHATCTLPNNMENCVFLPAAGYRYTTGGGTLSGQGYYGYYWSATDYNSNNGYYLRFYDTNSDMDTTTDKASAMSIRCVQ